MALNKRFSPNRNGKIPIICPEDAILSTLWGLDDVDFYIFAIIRIKLRYIFYMWNKNN